MAYIDDFENEFKTNLLQLKLNISQLTNEKVKKSLVKDNIESHIISALTLGAKQFIDTYYYCVLKVLNNKIKVEDLKSESIFNKYKNKFRRRFLDLFGDLDVIFTNGTDLELDPINIFKTNTLINTLIEKNSKINNFNSNYSNLERLPSSKSSDITEFKFTLDLLKDDYENSVFSSKMGNNMKITGIIKPEDRGEETKLFSTISGFSDSKILNIESVPTREAFYKGSGGRNGFLMYEANQFKPVIEKKIFNYLKNDLKIDIIESDIKIKIENDVFKDNTVPENKDIIYKLTVIDPKEDERGILGVINLSKDMKSFGLTYDLISSSYVYGYKDNKKIEFKKDIKNLVVKFSPNPNDNNKLVPTDDIEQYEKLIIEIIRNLEINFSIAYNTQIKLKIVKDEKELTDDNNSPKEELNNTTNNTDQLIVEYSVKISSEGSIESKEQPMGLFKKGTKGIIVEGINNKLSLSGKDYSKETEKNVLSLQKTKKIRVDGIVGDETWIPLFGYDRTLVDGVIRVYLNSSNTKYCTGTLKILDKTVELKSDDASLKKIIEKPNPDITEIPLDFTKGSAYFSDSKMTSKIEILKNGKLKSGKGKISNLKGNNNIDFATKFEDITIEKLTEKVIDGLQKKLDKSFPNFGTVIKKTIVENDVNSDILKNNSQTSDIENLSNNMLILLEQEFLKNGIVTFLKKVEKPIEITLKGDGNFTIFVESPKNDITSKIEGEINFMSTNSAITGLCEIKGLPSNFTNTKTNVVVKTTEYMYSTSQSSDSPENRISLGNEAIAFFESKIKSDYDIELKLSLRDKFAEKLEDNSNSSPIISTKFSEMDGEWIFNVEKENSFVNKDFGTLIIIGEPSSLDNKYPEGLDDEYKEDNYSGETDIDQSEQFAKNQEELMNDLTFEIAYENNVYIQKENAINNQNPTTTVVSNNPAESPVIEVNSGSITPVGKFQLFGGNGAQRIINMIYKGESGGKVGIFNYKPGYKASSKAMMDAVRIDNMTLRDLYKYMTQEIHPNIGGKIWASGVFQIIPSTLKSNIDKYKISWDKKYDATTQQEFGKYLIYNNAGSYLKGLNGGSKSDLSKAIQNIGQVWASLPITYWRQKDGSPARYVKDYANLDNGGGNTGCYGGDGINPSTVRTEIGTVVINMIKARIEISGKSPSFIPDYAKNI